MFSVTSLFLILWFGCRPESREGEYRARWWPCILPFPQAVKKTKTSEVKPHTPPKQEPIPPALTLRNVFFIFLTAEVNLVDGAHGSWRDEKKPKKLVATRMLMEIKKQWGRDKPTVWHHWTMCKMCEISTSCYYRSVVLLVCCLENWDHTTKTII